MALKKKYETLVKLKTAIVASNTTMKKVATHMGISVTQLSYKVNKYNIHKYEQYKWYFV